MHQIWKATSRELSFDTPMTIFCKDYRSRVTNTRCQILDIIAELDIGLDHVGCMLTFRGRGLAPIVDLTYLVGERDGLADERTLCTSTMTREEKTEETTVECATEMGRNGEGKTFLAALE